MSFYDVFIGSGGILVALLTLIQITPIKINPWSAILSWIGKQTQKETLTKIKDLHEDLKTVKADVKMLQFADEMKEAQDCRYRILRFADECYLGQNHSLEHYKQILQDVTTYEQYCDNHPEFPNSVAVIAIQQIKANFQKHVDRHDFLQ